MSGGAATPHPSLGAAEEVVAQRLTRLHEQLARAKTEMSAADFEKLDAYVQPRLGVALAALTAAKRQAAAWAAMDTPRQDSPQRPYDDTAAAPRVLHGPSPAPRAPPPALVRRIISSPNLAPHVLFTEAEDEDQPARRQPRSLRHAKSVSAIRLVFDAQRDGSDDDAMGGSTASAPGWAARPTGAARRAGGLPHAASVATLPSHACRSSSSAAAATTAMTARLRSSASLATIVSLVEEGSEDLVGNGGGGGGGGGSATAGASPRLVQYVRVAAAVAPASVVMQRFAHFLVQRQARQLLTFSPSTLAPTLDPRPSSLPQPQPRPQPQHDEEGDEDHSRSRPRRYPLRVEATRCPVKPSGFAAKKAALDAQGWYCKGCLAPFTIRHGTLRRGLVWPSLDEANFCFYTGGYFCARCLPPYRDTTWRSRQNSDHTETAAAMLATTTTATATTTAASTAFAVLPARVLQHWDFTPYPVCTRAVTLLTALRDEPLYCLSALAPHLSHTAPPILASAMALRRQICAMRDVGVQCGLFRARFYGEPTTSGAPPPPPQLSAQEEAAHRRGAASAATIGTPGGGGDGPGGRRRACYIPHARRYWVETADWWSLADLVELHRCDGGRGVGDVEVAGAHPSAAVVAASLSHSLAGIFDDTIPTAASSAPQTRGSQASGVVGEDDIDVQPAAQATNDVCLLLANACGVMQSLRRIRRAMAGHLIACPVCVCNSIDVCRLCGPRATTTTTTTATTGAPGAAPPLTRKVQAQKYLFGQQQRRATLPANKRGSSMAPTAAKSSLTDHAITGHMTAVSMPVSPSAGRSGWGTHENPALLFMRMMLQDMESFHDSRPSASQLGSGGDGSSHTRRMMRAASLSALLSRSPSASLHDEGDSVEEAVLSTSTDPATPGGAAHPFDGSSGGEDEAAAGAVHDDIAAAPAHAPLTARLPLELLDHVVYVYDILHVCRCPRCGACHHRLCVAHKLGVPASAFTADAPETPSGSVPSWCTVCQSRSE